MAAEVILNSRSLDIRNLDAVSRGAGCRYLEVIRGPGDVLIAKTFRRVLPGKGVVVDLNTYDPKDAAEAVARMTGKAEVPAPLWGHWAVQHVEPFTSQEAAEAALRALMSQVGFIGARVLAATALDPLRLQVFYEDCGEEAAKHLPDGTRRVMLTPELVRLFGAVKDTQGATG